MYTRLQACKKGEKDTRKAQSGICLQHQPKSAFTFFEHTAEENAAVGYTAYFEIKEGYY